MYNQNDADLAIFLRALDGDPKRQELVYSLYERMKSEVVNFKYTKTDGSLRNAFGTRCMEIIEKYWHPSEHGPKRINSPWRPLFHYFDIQKKEWRCFQPAKIESLNTDYNL